MHLRLFTLASPLFLGAQRRFILAHVLTAHLLRGGIGPPYTPTFRTKHSSMRVDGSPISPCSLLFLAVSWVPATTLSGPQATQQGDHSRTVSPSLTPNGEIGSRYPSNVYDCNRLSLPILRQKQVQVLCCDVYLLAGCLL
jgi:hypothetical protein